LEIADYMSQNPSLQLAIDGSVRRDDANGRDQGLNDRRIGTVHDALIDAGVPANKMQTGVYGDTERRHDRQVEVLFRTMSD
jgi:outer membrane protein OmpA-like peptidoglycan-associated protein